MPKFFRNEFKLKGGLSAHIRQKPNGSYEIRYRKNGYNISVCAKKLSDAKERFLFQLSQSDPTYGDQISLFGEYAEQWLEVVKRPHVKANTFADYLFTFKTYIYPKFEKKKLKDIQPLDVQRLLNELYEKGTIRAAEKVYVLLKALFDFAVAEDKIKKSPVLLIKKPKAETKHGQAFSIAEEREIVKKCIAGKTACGYAYILMLYTGIRRAELATVELSDSWITVITAKSRKGVSAKKRKIPISPMLKPFLPFMTKENLKATSDKLSRDFARIVPGRHLHELRHTFITRCQECGISRELTSLWAGHRADETVTSNVYTHFSDEFQLKEAQKLRY